MSSMWISVKKYFSWSDSTTGNYKGVSNEERESDHDMMMECDVNFHTNTSSAKIDEEKRCGIQNYFDDEYLDLIIDEREDCSEDDYEDFNKLVEKAGIADLKNESVNNKDMDNTVRDSPVYSYKHKATVVDESESESEGKSEHDMGNESEKDYVSDMDVKLIKSKGEESVNDSSNRISGKNSHVAESKSISFMETEEADSYQDFQSYEDKVKDVSNLDTRKYYSDILPDVSSDELSEDEPLDTVPKESEELPGDNAATKGIKAIDTSSAPSDMLNLDDKNSEVTNGLHCILSSPVTNFELENKPEQFSKEELPSWKQRGRNMPELDVMNELPRQQILDSMASRTITEDKNGENNQQTVIKKNISPTKSMPELENGIDFDMKLCDETSFLVSSKGIVEGTWKEVRESVDSLSENAQGDKKDVSQALKEEDIFISFPSLQKDAFNQHRNMKEAKTCFAVGSSLKNNDTNEESLAPGNKILLLDEGKEERAFKNSSSYGLAENYRELSPLRKAEIKSKSTFLPISSTTLKLDRSSDKRIQGGSDEPPISHSLTEGNESRDEHGTVESKNFLDKEQNLTIKNKILTERTPEVNTDSDSVNNHDGRTGGTLEKNISVTDVRNEWEAKSVKKLCQQSISEELKHDEVRNTYKSYSQGNTEAKLDSLTVVTMPRLDIEVENTPRDSNHQNEELKNMCNGTKIQNHFPLEQDFCHSSRKMLTQGTPPGRSSIGAVEIKMENGILRLSVTPSGPEEVHHVNGREMTNSRAFDNCSLVSKEETGTELTRNQSQKNADYLQKKSGKSAEPAIVSDWFPASTSEMGIQTIAVSPMVPNLGKKADSQQMPIRAIEKDKAEVEIVMGRRKEPCRRVDDLRLTSESTPKSSFLINPLISVAEVGTQVNDDWSYESHSISDKSLVMKAEATTQTSMTETSRGQNAITISDLQQVLERIFGASHQHKLFPSSKANVETQTIVPNYLYPSSSQDNPEMASCNVSPARFHIKSSNLCMLEGSNDGLDGRSHCRCSTPVPYPLNSSNTASTSCSSASQYNSTPSRGPTQIKKLLDVSRHSRLEFNPVSQQTQKTVAKNLSNMMNHNESAVKCKGNCPEFWKSAKVTANSPQRITSPHKNLVVTPTSNGGPGAKQATPVKATHSGGKSSRKKTGQNFHDSNGCLNLENNSGDLPIPRGVNVTASPKIVSSTPNPIVFICCSCRAPGVSVQGRELVIIQRASTANSMIESAMGNMATANERANDLAKPVVKQQLDSPLKQNSGKVFQTDLSLSKTVSENNNDRKTTSGSQILRIFAANSLPSGRSAKTAKEDNVIIDKGSQERLKQNSNASLNPGDEDNATISSYQTFSTPPKHLVHGTDGSDLEDIDHVKNSATNVKSNENQHGSKSSEEAEQKNNVVSSHNSTSIQAKEHENSETSMVKEDSCNESSSIAGEPEEKNNLVNSHNSTPVQAKEHKNHELSMVKEESCNESSSIAENSLKNQSPSDKISSDRIEKENKKRKSSNNAEFENEITPTRCLRKREETSSSSLDKEKKKVKNDSSKHTKKSLSVSKSEQEVSAGKCPKKRKYPKNNNYDHAKKKKVENNFPRSTGPFQKRVVKTLRNDKEF